MRTSYYDDGLFDYSRFWQNRQYEDFSEKIALNYLIGFIPLSLRKKLVDVGSGFGRLTDVYLDKFRECVLVDPSKKLLKKARKAYKKETKISFKLGSSEDLPFKDKQFNVALMIRVFHHLKYPGKTIREIGRVLKPGGFFILEFANKTHLKARIISLFDKKRREIINSLDPVDLRLEEERANNEIPFFNYHPRWIENKVKKDGFEIVKKISVSNLRSTVLKFLFPLSLLLTLEEGLQLFSGQFDLSPSIFLLLKKRAN